VIEERRAVPTLLARADEAIKWHAVLLQCDWSLLAQNGHAVVIRACPLSPVKADMAGL
jgi:hypothetical protein